ncbi:MAG TPA: hypothetical protein VKX16_16345 [Chloroflexota bacterium]|nr:hypothetical protein [Chloroflexota bacterium]
MVPRDALNDTKILERLRARYLLGSAIVWTGTLLALAVVLSGTPYFMQILPILIGGIVWFVVIVPATMFTPQGPAPDDRGSRHRA